jgi:Ca2+-binding RTX toxin-like protein
MRFGLRRAFSSYSRADYSRIEAGPLILFWASLAGKTTRYLDMSIARMLRSFKRTRQAGSLPRSRRPGFETLEQRAMLIVGAAGLAPPTPLDEFTGVVRLGGTSLTNTSPTCSATLLESGRHLLTAGHCVVKNEQQQIVMLPQNPPGPIFGAFTLIFDGQATAPIIVGSPPATVEAALEALPNIDNVAVSSGPGFLGYTVVFRGDLAVTNVPQMFIVGAVSGAIPIVTTSQSGATGSPSARFDLPSGSYVVDTPNLPLVHPDFNNLSFTPDGEEKACCDIAIIELAAIAPLGAERYAVNEDRNEQDALVTFVGYGNNGQVNNGSISEAPNTAGVRRDGENVISDIDDVTGYLQADFDDGTDVNNVMGGTGLPDNREAMVVRGDSGGPGLIDNQIAGIHASADNANGWGTFGSILYMTRVSSFTQNRDALFDIHDIIETPDDVVLDMNLQDDGNDGSADVINVQLIGLGDNRVQITINGQEVWSDLKSRVLSLTILGSGDRDEVTIHDDLNFGVIVRGAGGNDELTGGPGDEELYGEGGGDTLSGGSGNDLLVGGSGADTLSGGNNNDQVIGGELITSLNDADSDMSADTLSGGSGDDGLIGDDGSFLPLIIRTTFGGSDTIRGGTGNDLVWGGFGNDYLEGQGGNDTIQGGVGNDTILGGWQLLLGQNFADGDDFINAGSGTDVVYGDNLTLQFPPTFSLLGGNDEVFGGDGNDTIYGQAGHDDLNGDAGDDLLHGSVGNDELRGGRGNDTLIGDVGFDLLFGEQENDTLDGGADNDILTGGPGNDDLFGQAGDDFANGEAGLDLVVGGLGNDQLFGGSEADVIIGGNQSLVPDAGADTIDGEGGNDLILGDSGTSNPLNVSSLVGGADTIQGGPGNDTIYAMAGNDFVGGGSGNDTINLGAGNDIANGDSGNDSLTGGSGNDFLAGSAGVDQLFGNAGDDWLIGGHYVAAGVAPLELDGDMLDGGSGADVLLGDSWSAGAPFEEGTFGGNDTLLGGDQDDFLGGQVGNDKLFGGNGNDDLAGGSGHDILLGEGGADALAGGDGRDVLIGGIDADTLDGGADDDILIAGTTAHDANDAALGQILDEWTSPRDHQSRVKNLKGIGMGNPEFDNRLNGTVFLNKNGPDATVFDDDASDELTGSAGEDWFLFDPMLDELVDWVPGEDQN